MEERGEGDLAVLEVVSILVALRLPSKCLEKVRVLHSDAPIIIFVGGFGRLGIGEGLLLGRKGGTEEVQFFCGIGRFVAHLNC